MEQALLDGEKAVQSWTYKETVALFFSYRVLVQLTNSRILISRKTNFPKKITMYSNARIAQILGTRYLIYSFMSWIVILLTSGIVYGIFIPFFLFLEAEEASIILATIPAGVVFLILAFKKLLSGQGVAILEFDISSNFSIKDFSIKMKTRDILEINNILQELITKT